MTESSLEIAAVQCTSVPRDVEANARDHARLAALAFARGCQLVLFPELSLTGYDLGLRGEEAVSATDPRLAELRALADAHSAVVVAGAPVVSTRGLHIGAICLLPAGRVQVYTKQCLHEGEEVAFVPGSGGDPLSLLGKLVGLAICADVTHPEHARSAKERGCAIYAAGCFLTPSGYDADCALLQGYAREHRMAVLMANYAAAGGPVPAAGKSAIWSSDGKRLAQAPPEGDAIVAGRWDGNAWSGEVSCCSTAASARRAS